MKKNRLFTTICLMAAILFTACTQDELSSPTGGVEGALPDGEFPLQIGSVSITAESSEEPWTRVAENETDGMGSHWTGDEEFYVKFEGSDEVGIYKITDAATGAVEPVKSIYWKNTQPANIIAWYASPQPNSANWMDLSDQKNGLAYVLRATADNASYDTPVSLQFKHQLAKVRVVTKGTVNVGSISIRYPCLCSVNEGIVTSGGVSDYLDSYKTYYEGVGTCWEINLPAGNDIEFCEVAPIENSAMMKYPQLTPPVTLEAGKVHTITITANWEGTLTIDLANEDYEINSDGIYYFSGTASHAIRVTGGNPEIYLEDAQISVSSGPAINIEGGNPTIHIKGNDNEVSSSDGAGIYVAENSTVTIQGNSTEDALTCEGNNLSAGIGGYMIDNNTAYNCGNIVIDNVTLTARSNQTSTTGDYAAGIGAVSNARVGSISISDAIIYADGGGDNSTMGAAAIGGGIDYLNLSGQTEFDITISNSTIHATRGCSYASYIGAGGWHGGTAGYNIISTANITGSIIYDESGTEITQ